MIVIHPWWRKHHNEDNICPYKTSSCFPFYKQTTVIWNFYKMPLVCLLPNKQLQFITKMRVVPTGDERKGGMVKDEQNDFWKHWTGPRELFLSINWGELGMLTLSLVLNAAAGGGGNITNLLLLFIVVVLILVLVVLIVKALICAVDQSTVVLTKLSLLMI